MSNTRITGLGWLARAALAVSLLLVVTPGVFGQGGFIGPGNGGPATGTVSGNVLTYNGATYVRDVYGRVTFPDCTRYLVTDGGMLFLSSPAPNCTPGGPGSGSGVFVGPGSGGPATGTMSGNILTYNGATYVRDVDGRVTFPDCTRYLVTDTGMLFQSSPAANCTPSGGTGTGLTTPVMTWANPAAVVAGTALSGTQLNATATVNGSAVAGTFAYTPAAGTVLNTVGTQSLSVTFTPGNLSAYALATATVSIAVTTSGGGGAFQGPGNGGPATGTVSGNILTYNGAAYMRDSDGRVTFPDCTRYLVTDGGMLFLSSPAPNCTPGGGTTLTTPVMTWANPAAVVAGTVLGGTQLNATATASGSAVAGTFAYTPAAGTALNTVGTQLLSVAFTPSNLSAYAPATATVSIVVTASGGGGAFQGPGSGGPATGTVIGNILTYNGATYLRGDDGRVTFPDCTRYLVTDSGMLFLSSPAINCTPGGSGTGTGGAVGPSTGGPSWGTVNGNILTYNGGAYSIVNGLVQLPDCMVYSVGGSGALTYVRAAVTCTPGAGSGSGGSVGPSNGGPSSGTVNGNILTYNGGTFTIVNGLVQLPDCNVYGVDVSGALTYVRAAATCTPGSGGSPSSGSGTPTAIPGVGPMPTWSEPKRVVTTWGGRGSSFGRIDMAYDQLTQRYLIVWRAAWSGPGCGEYDAIYGQFLDVNADPAGLVFLISVGNDCSWAFSGWEPAVAATGDGRFIVSYARNDPAAGPYSVAFNLVEYNGGPQVAPPVRVDANTSREATAVAWMPHGQHFLMMWSKADGLPRTPRNPDGTLVWPNGVKAVYSMTITREGGLSQIYKVTDNPDLIDMAFARIAQGADNNVMVVTWRDSTNQFMAPNGGIGYTQVTEGGSPMMNTGNIVGPNGGRYRFPMVAYNSQTNKYFAIYTDYNVAGCNGAPSYGNIMARNFEAGGTPVESESYTLWATLGSPCNGVVGDDQFTELGLAYEPVNNAFVVGARGQDGASQPQLPVYRMVTDPSGKAYQSSMNSVPATGSGGSPVPVIVADGTGRVLFAYRPDAVSIFVMFGSR